MPTKIKEIINERQNETLSTGQVLKFHILGSFPKVFSFLFWLGYLILTPFIAEESIFGILFIVGLYFFLLNSLTSLLLGQKWDNLIGLIINLVAALLLMWYVGFHEYIIYLGYGYLVFQELLTLQKATPIIKSLNMGLRTYKIKKPGLVFIILLIIFTLAQNYLFLFVLVDIDEQIELGILFWELADFLVTITIIIILLIIRKRKDPFHHNLKSMMIWVFLVLKIMTIPIAYDFYQAFSNQDDFVVLNFNLLNISKTILLMLLIVWDLGKEITEGSFDQSSKRHSSLFNFLYCVSLFAVYIEIYGFDWSIGMYNILFIGIGVFLLVKKLADDTAKVQHISNYKFLHEVDPLTP